MYELCESISGYIWSFLIYTELDMELMNQFDTVETNKTATIVVKLSEKLLDGGHAVWMDSFYNSPELIWVMKSKTDCGLTLYGKRKNYPAAVKTKKLKKEERRALRSTHRRCGSSCMAKQEVHDYNMCIPQT
jgi:hypothetical protein